MSDTPTLATDVYGITRAMDRYAGNWGRHFSALLKASDPSNRQRLLDAFPELVQRYGPGSRLYEDAAAAESSASPYPIYF